MEDAVVNLKHRGEFQGSHMETGTICKALACRGIKAPHTGKPYSEALLFVVSGGIALGYFVFQYKGFPAHVALMTRNTFDPFPATLERLGIIQDLQETIHPDRGLSNVIEALDSGVTPVVWVDVFTLKYNQYPQIKNMWGTMPILVHGYNGDSFLIADRSKVSWRLSTEEFMAERARIKDIRFRAATLSPPDKAKLKEAVLSGIRQCIRLFRDGSPRGAKDSFGFGAFQNWADMLVNKRNKQSWERVFSTGRDLYQGLAGMVCQPGVFGWIMTWSGGPGAARGVYADFLDEAATILERPQLNDVAQQFRRSMDLWSRLARSAVPDRIPCLFESGNLLLQRRELFVEKGPAGQDGIRKIDKHLDELANASKTLDPSSEEVRSLLASLRDQVLHLRDTERAAIEALQDAVE
jgi:hypothetical protein